MSPSARASGKLSRVTFNSAIKSVWSAFAASSSDDAYQILSGYLHAWMARFAQLNCEQKITNPIIFRAIILLFPDVAQRVSDRYNKDFSAQNFTSVLEPFSKMKAQTLKNTGNSHIALYEKLQKTFRQHFTIAGA
jgi:hypothetical protein